MTFPFLPVQCKLASSRQEERRGTEPSACSPRQPAQPHRATATTSWVTPRGPSQALSRVRALCSEDSTASPRQIYQQSSEPRKINDQPWCIHQFSERGEAGEGNIIGIFSTVPAWIWREKAANRAAGTENSEFLCTFLGLSRGNGLSPKS